MFFLNILLIDSSNAPLHDIPIPGQDVGLAEFSYRCNRLRCPLARMSGLQCINMGHNDHGINLYGVSMTLMGN